jgi:predicted dehydrogenase
VGLKLGVIGTGRLGREHVRVFKHLSEVDFVGCYDVVTDKSRQVARQFDAEAFDDVNRLLEAVDAVSIVVPTTHHASVSLNAIEHDRDVFVEKPIAGTVEDAERILRAVRERGKVLQIGHIERFNGVIQKSLPYISSPLFIEIHRLAPFNIRGIDVSVIMDLMIHDLDLLLFLLRKEPVEIRAKGAGILTEEPDIVNARLEFADGCVANMTASRVSLEPMRKIRIFSPSRYLSIDLFQGKVKHLQKRKTFETDVMKLREQPEKFGRMSLRDFIKVEEFKIESEEPLRNELRSFCRSLLNGESPPVTGEDGLRALKLAAEIQKRIASEGVA